MSETNAPVVVFGDFDLGLWGVILGGARPRLAVAGLTDPDVVLRTADLALEDGEAWELNAAGAALRVQQAERAATATVDGHQLTPCRVTGAATIAETEREFDVAGVSVEALHIDRAESQRLFASWFAGGHEVALLSARATGAKGQDHDEISVIAVGEEHPVVLDPRLSTTYDVQGDPLRVGIELWLADDPDSSEHWSRRIAGAATGSRVADAERNLSFSAHAMDCVRLGERGAGVYLLAQPA